MGNLYEGMMGKLLMEMKLMDITVKGISDSPEHHDAQSYNAGIRAAMKILDTHKEELRTVSVSES